MPGSPFRSVLEPFLEFIAEERRKRVTWKAIAESIRDKGTPCTPQGVQDYFKRKQKRKKMPLGFEPEQPPPEAPSITPEFKERYLRSREQAEAPPIQPLSIIDPDDET